jgi:hypothetical protein
MCLQFCDVLVASFWQKVVVCGIYEQKSNVAAANGIENC